MKTKLTLSLNKRVIDNAKDYARIHNISLSEIVESDLESLTKQKLTSTEISPFVESLRSGIQLDKDIDYKKEYSNYLIEKYK